MKIGRVEGKGCGAVGSVWGVVRRCCMATAFAFRQYGTRGTS
jgi:hypothetical protein